MIDSSRITAESVNSFFDMMPAGGKEALRPFLRRRIFKQQQPIYARDEVIEAVHFPIDAIMSVVTDFADGETAEAGIIGRDGTTAHVLALGQTRSAQRVFVQVAGRADSIGAAEFRAALDSKADLRAYTLRYVQATIAGLSQSAACNVLHPANERCARWLLAAHDRVAGDVVLLTQEFLGQMLGLRRGSVALATSALQEAGVISYSRGHITIRNRNGLERIACECYRSIEKSFVATMGYTITKSRPNQ